MSSSPPLGLAGVMINKIYASYVQNLKKGQPWRIEDAADETGGLGQR
jgi:hypothetical protein